VAVEDKLDIKLNQNVWALVIAFVALGAAEHWGLRWLFGLSLAASVGAIASVAITTVAYTSHYWNRKCIQIKTIKRKVGKLRLGPTKQ
jgi:hypothetical protein